MPVDVRFSPATECEGKRQFRTKKFAKRIARRTEARGGGRRMHAYRCHYCGFHHVGHRPDPAAFEAARARVSPLILEQAQAQLQSQGAAS
jgi:hypothetical protein